VTTCCGSGTGIIPGVIPANNYVLVAPCMVYPVVPHAFKFHYKDFHRSTQKITELVLGKKVIWHVSDAQRNFVKERPSGMARTLSLKSPRRATRPNFALRTSAWFRPSNATVTVQAYGAFISTTGYGVRSRRVKVNPPGKNEGSGKRLLDDQGLGSKWPFDSSHGKRRKGPATYAEIVQPLTDTWSGAAQ